jgi:cytochrome c biogenesis protein ResB
MVAAKAGSANKLGYIAAHSAIVLVCLGGLLDCVPSATIRLPRGRSRAPRS